MHNTPPMAGHHEDRTSYVLALMSKLLALLTGLARTLTTLHLWPAITRNGHLMS
ncbi:hypothetical protein TIFTF001_032801 [Ficus carica]|uniref:Uncharacterized protein n=1 Tax=Ficus carica TaxID=3494 RepID=A0AA88J8E1_FICCA|nr:hypothetical protein TIFTF001_032801 [Ficus carica]